MVVSGFRLVSFLASATCNGMAQETHSTNEYGTPPACQTLGPRQGISQWKFHRGAYSLVRGDRPTQDTWVKRPVHQNGKGCGGDQARKGDRGFQSVAREGFTCACSSKRKEARTADIKGDISSQGHLRGAEHATGSKCKALEVGSGLA